MEFVVSLALVLDFSDPSDSVSSNEAGFLVCAITVVHILHFLQMH
jgi:hypothetical protein